jgi:hypothetical protein
MRMFLAAAAAAALFGAPTVASATIVNIDATTSGCDFNHCSGQHNGPGVVVDSIFSPTQLTLAAGSYTVTNANGLAGANPNFTSWNFNKSGDNWLWSFMAIIDSSRTILLDSLPDAGITVVSTQAAAAGEAAAVNYVGHFTLAQATTIDFVTEDYIPQDNLGGMSLNVQLDGQTSPGVPEPASWTLMIIGFGFAGTTLRRRRRMVAA